MILIAASNARQATKDAADFVCVGVDDQEQIEAAINLLSATGGIIHLSEGMFNLSGALVLDSVPIQLRGEGRSATVLGCEFPEEDTGIQLVSSRHGLSDFSLVNAANLRNGIALRGAYNHVARLVVDGAISTGVSGEGDNSQSLLEHVQAANCGEWGFKLYGSANRSIACIASRSSVLGVGGYGGFRFQGSGGSHQGCIVDKFAVGLEVVNYASGLSVSGAHVEACNQALVISGAEGMEPKGISVSLAVFNLLDPVLPAIYIGRSTGALVRATLFGVASGQEVQITSEAQDTQVE